MLPTCLARNTTSNVVFCSGGTNYIQTYAYVSTYKLVSVKFAEKKSKCGSTVFGMYYYRHRQHIHIQ